MVVMVGGGCMYMVAAAAAWACAWACAAAGWNWAAAML